MSGVVLRVDETVIYATDMGAAYWSKWRQAHRPDRFRVVGVSLMGEIVEVGCDGREHAEWLRDFLVGRAVSAMLGHASINTTVGIYGKEADEARKREAWGQALRRVK